ncbi:divergent polysaccharide deacetylase family protein [Marinibacterium sp. SX1]|uniref:divergent polysaccharide deacetylase family protein n=1 Tax=Marinibacterium sp. SX1 TaxID=3388424 RepID=UPI003D1840CA
MARGYIGGLAWGTAAAGTGLVILSLAAPLPRAPETSSQAPADVAGPAAPAGAGATGLADGAGRDSDLVERPPAAPAVAGDDSDTLGQMAGADTAPAALPEVADDTGPLDAPAQPPEAAEAPAAPEQAPAASFAPGDAPATPMDETDLAVSTQPAQPVTPDVGDSAAFGAAPGADDAPEVISRPDASPAAAPAGPIAAPAPAGQAARADTTPAAPVTVQDTAPAADGAAAAFAAGNDGQTDESRSDEARIDEALADEPRSDVTASPVAPEASATAPVVAATPPAAPAAGETPVAPVTDDTSVAPVTDATEPVATDAPGDEPRLAALPQITEESPGTTPGATPPEDRADVPGDTDTTIGTLAPNASPRLPVIGGDDAPATPEPDPAPSAIPPVEAFAAPFANPEDKPLMAIVLIDGPDAVGAEALADFPYPLTFAIDPTQPGAAARMRAHRAAGFEVMALVDLPAAALPSDAEVSLAAGLATLDEVVGVLEGTGTGIQGNRPLSDQVTGILAQTGHGLVTQDNGLNTVPKLAAREGVPTAIVFRDFDGAGQTPTVMRRFLDQAAFRAGQQGSVLMLGRVQPDTVSALLLWGLQDRASRVALAPVTAVLSKVH